MSDGAPARVVVHGAAGRMGRMLIRAVRERPGLVLRAAVESARSEHLGQDAGLLSGGAAAGVLLSADLDGALSAADVVIDFTTPSATTALAQRAADRGVSLVIGTTGLGEPAQQVIDEAARRVPVMWSANMSLGVSVLLGLLPAVSRALSEFDVEIVELHHRMKQDAPSGTALMMAQAIAAERGVPLTDAQRAGRSGQVGARTAAEIGVMALRGGDVVGEHTVYLLGAGERIEITHRATSREIFARGAARAAEWLARQRPGRYDMQDVLGLRG